MNRRTVLISNQQFPPKTISSWPYRIFNFIESSGSVDYILSPSNYSSKDSKYIYCKKRKWPKLTRLFRNVYLKHWVAVDFYVRVISLLKQNNNLNVVVIDDPHLLELMAIHVKEKYPNLNLIFSFHGHEINLKSSIIDRVDRIIFQTHSGYLDTRKKYFQFLPEVFVVGNAVDGMLFKFPKHEERMSSRKRLGIEEGQIAVSWIANARLSKGIEILKKLIRYFENDNRFRFIVIGYSGEIQSKNAVNLGRLPKEEIPEYLQACDVNLFTSLCREGFPLSLTEAIKCGNLAIASDSGAVREIAQMTNRVRVVKHPNILMDWIQVLKEITLKDCHVEEADQEPIKDLADSERWKAEFKKSILS